MGKSTGVKVPQPREDATWKDAVNAAGVRPSTQEPMRTCLTLDRSFFTQRLKRQRNLLNGCNTGAARRQEAINISPGGDSLNS